jgi:thiol:disulfide interchange protein DsbC
VFKKILLSSATFISLLAGDIPLSEFKDIKIFEKNNIQLQRAIDIGSLYMIDAKAVTNRGVSDFNIFVTKDKKVAIIGNGLDLNTSKPLFIPKDMSKYEKDASFVVGEGKKKFYLFTDPECPYCKKFEKLMPNYLKKAKFFVYFFPLEHHKNAKNISLWIDSQKDKFDAMQKSANDEAKGYDKLSKETIAKYEERLMKQMDVALELGVGGTPSLYDENGGSIAWNEIESHL